MKPPRKTSTQVTKVVSLPSSDLYQSPAPTPTSPINNTTMPTDTIKHDINYQSSFADFGKNHLYYSY